MQRRTHTHADIETHRCEAEAERAGSSGTNAEAMQGKARKQRMRELANRAESLIRTETSTRAVTTTEKPMERGREKTARQA